ncbi:hypothetical protein [Thermogemmata fonticola]|jgi:hypothetical protein|uniref:Uncharacterized protein n=1 Tax=Thermogemmata fonticola TaxID=2755323 RepID=A0A7V8VB59_9BACT|nr:hypothetical protein [Thermogemmata fonticola]MBA2224807.1 hypothetical protein [Thermogemmata fonticola]
MVAFAHLRLSLAMLLVTGVVLFGGCGPARLNVDKKYTMDVGDARAIDLEAQAKPQKVNVEFSVSEGEARVLVFRAEDAQGDEGILEAPASKALSSQRGSTGNFTVDLPPNTKARVVIRDLTKKADVTIKVTNQQ